MNKQIDYYLGLPYTIELLPNEDGSWFAKYKELPGCMTSAETPEEALASVRQILPEWLDIAMEQNFTIPEPTQQDLYSGNFRLRVPRSMHRQLAETAEHEGISMNAYISTLLAGALGSVNANSVQANRTAPTKGYLSALKAVCLAAGMGNLEGKDPEAEFSIWFTTEMDRISDYLLAKKKDRALQDLNYLVRLVRPNCKNSPILLKLVDLLEWTKQTLEQSVEEATEASQNQSSGMKDAITVANKSTLISPRAAISSGLEYSQLCNYSAYLRKNQNM